MNKCLICFGREPEPEPDKENDVQDYESVSSITLSGEEIDYEKTICAKALLKLLYLPEIPFEMLLKNDSIIICNNCKKRLMVVDHVLNELEVLQGKIVVARRIFERDLVLSYQHQDEEESKDSKSRPGDVDVNSTCGVRKFICDLMQGHSQPVLDRSILGTIPVVKKQRWNAGKRKLEDYLDGFIEEENLKGNDLINPIENVTALYKDDDTMVPDIFGGSINTANRLGLGRPSINRYSGIVQNINSTVRSAPNGYVSPSSSYRVFKAPVKNSGGAGLTNPQLREKVLLQQSVQRPRSPMPIKEPSILLDKDEFKKLIVDDAKEKKFKLHIHVTSLPIVPREVKTVNMVSNEKVNKFLTNENIKLHILQTERDMIHRTCRVCSKILPTKTKCETHLNTIHLGIIERQFECSYLNCTRKFKQQFLLNQHIRLIHLGLGFKCTVENCSKVLSTQRSQIKHSEKCPLLTSVFMHPKINYNSPSNNYVQQFQSSLPPINFVRQFNPPSSTLIVDISLPDNIGDRNLPEELLNDPLA